MQTKTKKHLPETYRAVGACLKEGKEEAITSQDIVQLSGVGSKRDVMEIIERLIVDHGYVIGSSRNGSVRGYYLISNESELHETLFSFNNQINSMLKRHKKLNENYIASQQIEGME